MATQTTYDYPVTGITFLDRDGYASGNPEKAIKGSQVDPEMVAIAAAVNAKMDFNAVAGEFTGLIDGGTIDGGIY